MGACPLHSDVLIGFLKIESTPVINIPNRLTSAADGPESIFMHFTIVLVAARRGL